MKNLFARWLSWFRGPTVSVVVPPRPKLSTALTELNAEFVTLNEKLVELRDALGLLQAATRDLQSAQGQRDVPTTPSRHDLN